MYFLNVTAAVLMMVLASTRVVAAGQESLSFNGTVFTRAPTAEKQLVYKSQRGRDFVETISIRSVVPNGKFEDVSQQLIALIKRESNNAELLVMERAATRELVVAYLREPERNKLIYKVERLSVSEKSSPVSIAYSSELKVSNASENSDSKIKVTAMKAVATFDMDRARQLLHAEQ